ncbi:MAG TPA: DUF1579 domain-containing protein [Tepidisphaeraceae bacterium]|jgi:hypothetical protein
MRKGSLLVAAILVAGGVWVMAAADSAGTSADQQKQMEAMMKLAAPGAQHAKLKSMAGKFDAAVTWRMSPDQPEQKSQGTCSNEMLFDRYLKQDYSGDMMGMPFKGTGLVAYDNAKQKYVSTWADSMSTGIMVMEGEADAGGNVITQKCEMDCPLEPGKKMQSRMVTTIKDENTHTAEMFQTPPGGKEFKCMTIQYTRAK